MSDINHINEINIYTDTIYLNFKENLFKKCDKEMWEFTINGIKHYMIYIENNKLNDYNNEYMKDSRCEYNDNIISVYFTKFSDALSYYESIPLIKRSIKSSSDKIT